MKIVGVAGLRRGSSSRGRRCPSGRTSPAAAGRRSASARRRAACRGRRRQLVPERLGGERGLREVERDQVHRLVVGEPAALVGQHLLADHDRAEAQPHAERRALLEHALDVRVGLALGLRVPVAVERPHERAAVGVVERVDLELAPAVQVDRALVDGRGRRADVDVADHLARLQLDDRHAVARGAAQRERARRVLLRPARDERAVGALAQVARRRPAPSAAARQRGPSTVAVRGLQRRLVRGAQQVRGVELLVLVVEDRRLDRPLEELVGVAAEELVERVVAGDVDRQPAARGAPRGPTSGAARRRSPGTSRRSRRPARRCRCPSSKASVDTTPSSSPLTSRASSSRRCCGV